MTNHDQFDELLDHALSKYRDAEPLSGLEDRVLRGLEWPRKRHSASPQFMRLGAFATGAALLLFATFLVIRSHRPQVPGEQAASTGPAPVVHPSATPVKDSAVATARRSEPQTSMRPKSSDVQSSATIPSPVQAFPTPVRMTNEEHALVAVATAHPDVLQASAREDELITIAPVVIKPLASATEHEGDN